MVEHALSPFGQRSEPPVSWLRIVKIWWLMTWRATVGSAVTGIAIGIVVAIVGIILHWSSLTRTIVIFSIGTLVGFVWRVIAVRMALGKKYSDFRLNLSDLP